ncbi:ommochrome-binding protein-like [Leptidea sinapis]|uniref:ommochrome-binding protein-like n=1 Tax=Leptidea sinapis TaxID=189913 RepID=UPI0021366809|nr:ommochrome-binding protein-like [Leptidea sinapis]
MLLLLLLTVPDVAVENNVKNEKVSCDGLLFHDVYYDREILVGNLGRPYNLVVHKQTGVLLFSHTVQNGTEIDFEIMACHFNKEPKQCDIIGGIPGGYAIAYDSANDDIYFGGHDGIYKYNFFTKSAEFFDERGKSIWGLFIRKNFYYIEYPTQKLYVYQNDDFVKVAEAVNIEIDNFFVSKAGDIYFANKTALYKVESVGRRTVVLSDEVMVRQIADDKYGDIYICGTDGIYLEDKPFNRIKRIAEIDHAFGITFDGDDNAIYANRNTIYRLLPSNTTGTCYNEN